MNRFFRIPGAMKCSVKSQRIAKLAFRNEVNVMKLGYDSLNERRTPLVRCIDRRHYSTGPQKIEEKKVIRRLIWMPSIFLRDYSGKIHYDDTEYEEKFIWSNYVPLDYHQRELSKKEVKIDYLNQLIGEKNEELATAQGQTKKILAIVAPAYIRKYIEETEKRLLSRCLFDVNDYDSMLKVLNVSNETITKKMRQLFERVADENEFGLKDSLQEKISYHYVAWTYILTAADPNDEDIKQLKRLMDLLDVSQETFAAEISFLWVKSSNFGVHDISESGAINLDALIAGLRFYKISFPSTRKVVEVLFKLITS